MPDINLDLSMGMTHKQPLPRREPLIRLLLLGASTLLSILVLEFALRLLSPPSPFTPLIPLRPHYKAQFQLTNFNGMSLHPRYSTDKWGLRGEEPPPDWKGSRTIIAVGGSTTECRLLDDPKTWPLLLQEMLRTTDPTTWVGNGGISGQTTRGHLVFLDEIIRKLRPDMVILLVGVNDLWAAMREDYRHQGTRADRPVRSLFYRAFTSSRLLQFLYLWKQVFVDHVEVQGFDATERMEFPPLTDAVPFETALEDLGSDLRQYRQRIEQIIGLAKSLGVAPVFLTQPLLFDDTPYWRQRDGVPTWIGAVRYHVSAATHWRFLDRYNRELLSVCHQERVPCFDLASEVPHDQTYFYDAMHLNERGAKLVAEKVSEFLVSLQVPSSTDTQPITP